MDQTTRTAFCFKNGFSLINETFAVPANTSKFTIAKLSSPNPVHGSLWFEGPKILSVSSAQEPLLKKRPALTLVELIQANVGNKVSLLVSSHQADIKASWQTGTIVGIPGWNNDEALPGTPAFSLGSFVQFEVENNDVCVIPLSSVLQLRGANLKSDFLERRESKGVILQLENSDQPRNVDARFITGDFTWAPSYKISLVGKAEGLEGVLQIQGHACVINDSVEAESFSSLNLLAGVPNITFSHVTDPLAAVEACSSFLANLGSGGGQSFDYSRPQRLQRNVMSNVASQSYGSYESTEAPKVEDSNADDLHVYKFQNVSLKKGQRVFLSLFDSAEIKYSDVHESEVSLTAYPQQKDQTDVPVWHSIKFENKTKLPWTTGPVLVTTGHDQLVCQSDITYTPVGGEVQVKLTKALGVRLFHNESVSRKATLKTILSTEYLQCAAAGTFCVKNHKKSPVKLVIKMSIVGELAESSIAPTKNVETAASSDLANSSRNIIYELLVEPSKEIQIKYNRTYWVRK